MAAGRIVEIDVQPTLADGLSGNLDPDTLTFDIVRRLVPEIALVSEPQLRGAIAGLMKSRGAQNRRGRSGWRRGPHWPKARYTRQASSGRSVGRKYRSGAAQRDRRGRLGAAGTFHRVSERRSLLRGQRRLEHPLHASRPELDRHRADGDALRTRISCDEARKASPRTQSNSLDHSRRRRCEGVRTRRPQARNPRLNPGDDMRRHLRRQGLAIGRCFFPGHDRRARWEADDPQRDFDCRAIERYPDERAQGGLERERR